MVLEDEGMGIICSIYIYDFFEKFVTSKINFFYKQAKLIPKT